MSQRATRAVDGAALQAALLSAKGSRHAFGIAQSTRKECIHLCSHSGPIHGLTWRILMGERWVITQRRVAVCCARYEICHCKHLVTAKGSRHALGMAKACVRSVSTMGVCMSTPLRTGEALDMMNFDGREVARARPRDACALGRAVCCEHILSAKGSSVQGGVWAGPE